LISDGEDQSEGYEDALKQLRDEQVIVFSVGIGSQNGGPIPVYDEESDRLLGYHRSQDGSVVNSRLQRDALQNIAALGDGEYYEISNSSSGLDRFLGKLDELKKGTFSSQEFVDFKNQYQWLVGFGLCFLVLSLFMPETKRFTR
jgi:Ca-activated chloride channel family protein